MSLVIDASVTLAWYFEDETAPSIDAVLDRVVKAGAIAPNLWRLEVANAFQSAIRRKRIDASYRDRALAALSQLPISIDAETDFYAWSTTLWLAERVSLTVYDATYLELAQRRNLPLATIGKKLRDAATAIGVDLID